MMALIRPSHSESNRKGPSRGIEQYGMVQISTREKPLPQIVISLASSKSSFFQCFSTISSDKDMGTIQLHRHQSL